MKALLLAALLVPASRLPAAGSAVVRQALQMGTIARIEVDASGGIEGSLLAEEALEAIERVEFLLSEWRPDSEVSWLGRTPVGETIPVSPELAAILDPVLSVSRATGYAFDPALGALSDAWGIHGEFREPGPEEQAVSRLAVGSRAVEFAPGALTFCRNHPLARLDTGGFGKGAALDEAAAVLRSRGVRRALLDLGGQLLAVGGPYEVRIADPRDRSRSVGEVELSSASASTSGNSERSGMVAGKRIGHLLDPRSGRPAADFGSVTVVVGQALLADALSTALFVLGPDAAGAVLQQWPSARATFVLHRPDGTIEVRR